MLVNVNQVLKTITGVTMQDIAEEIDENGETVKVAVDATVKTAIVNAVLSPVQSDKGIDKIKKYELAKKVYASDEVDLNEDEIKLIKDRVGEVYIPIIVGQIYELLKV